MSTTKDTSKKSKATAAKPKSTTAKAKGKAAAKKDAVAQDTKGAAPTKKTRTAVEMVTAGREAVAKHGLTPIDPNNVRGYTSFGCYPLDLCTTLGKGWGWSRVIEIYGPKFSGKTYVAMNASYQTIATEGAVYWYDIEHGWDKDFADLNDLQAYSPLFTLYPQIHAEKALQSILDLMRLYQDCDHHGLVVLDSIGRLCTTDRDQRPLEEGRKVGNLAQVMHDFCTVLASLQPRTNLTILAINQEYKGIPIPPSRVASTYTRGGTALEYAAHLRIRMSPSEINMTDKGVPRYGIIKASITKNKSNLPLTWCEFPVFFKQTSSRVYGLDDAFACLSLAVQLGALKTNVTKDSESKSKRDMHTVKVTWDGEEMTFRALRDKMYSDVSTYRRVRRLLKKAYYSFYRIVEDEDTTPSVDTDSEEDTIETQEETE